MMRYFGLCRGSKQHAQKSHNGTRKYLALQITTEFVFVSYATPALKLED